VSHWTKPIRNCDQDGWSGAIQREPWGVGSSCGSTLARVPKTRRPRSSRRSSRALRSYRSFFPTGGRPILRRCCKLWGVYRPRRRGTVGRKPKPRLVAPKNLYYAQVVKVRDKAGHVVEVSRHVVFGGPRRFGKQLRLRQLGETLPTALMARWYGTLRGLVAPVRRRTRCLSWSHARHRGKVWLMVSLYNFVMPHKSLRQGRTARTPAMALGLTDHVWS
jgi:hypothetical protein